MRVVIDADILVAAYTEDGEVCDFWKNSSGGHSFLISPEIFTAVENQFRKSSGRFTPVEIRNFLKDILKRCEMIRPPTISGENKTAMDEKDRALIHLAQGSGADLLLTSRLPLQKMKSLGNILILSFSQFIIQRAAS